MENLIIIGAGGFGREILMYAQEIQKEKQWKICGFLDDNHRALDGYSYDIRIIGSIKDYIPLENDRLVMGIESPHDKLAISKEILGKGGKFISLIHPKAEIGANVQIGRGCVVCPHSFVTCHVNIGNFVTLNVHSAIGHDVIIEDGCTISSFAHVSGRVKLGTGAYIGIHGCVLPKVEVGDFATVGAGSVAIKTVKPGTTVMGVPGKKIC